MNELEMNLHTSSVKLSSCSIYTGSLSWPSCCLVVFKGTVERISKPCVRRRPCAPCGVATHRSTPRHKNFYWTWTRLSSLTKTSCRPCLRWCQLLKGRGASSKPFSHVCFCVSACSCWFWWNSFDVFRAVVSPAKALLPAIRPLLNSTFQNILQTVSRVFPHAELGLKRKRQHGEDWTTFFGPLFFIVGICNIFLFFFITVVVCVQMCPG